MAVRRNDAATGRYAARSALLYLAISVVWIAVSDRVVEAVVSSRHHALAQTFKGVLFVAATALLIFTFVRRFGRARDAADASAREESARLESLVHSAPIGIALHDLDLRVVRVNEQMAEIIGVPASEQLGRTLQEFLPGVAPFVEPLCRKVLETGETVVDVEITGESQAEPGIARHWLASVFPVPGPDGSTGGVGVAVRDITTQRAAERELHERSETLRAIFDHIPAMLALFGPDGSLRFVNRELTRTLGWTLDEACSVDFFSEVYTDPEERERALAFIGESTGEFERFSNRTKDGRLIPVEWANVRLPDGRGLGIGRDVTETVEAERSLLRSEERYRTLVDRIPAITYINAVDPDDPQQTDCVFISPQLREVLGYEPADWLADDELWQKVIHPDDLQAVLEANRRADDGAPLDVEYRAVTKGGRTVWIHDEGVFVPAEGDGIAYWLGLMVDITAEREMQAELMELNESFRGIFAASPLPIMVIELDGRVRHWNTAAERAFGWTADEVIGEMLPYVPEDRLEEFRRMREQVVAGETFSGVALHRKRKDGTPVLVSLSTAPMRGPDGSVNGIVAVAEDVTERRRTADQVALQAELLANVNDAVVATDEALRITYWNRGAELMYGWGAAETIGQLMTELLRPELDEKGAVDIMESLVAAGEWRGQIVHRRKDGSGVAVDATTVVRTRLDGTRYFLSVNRDASERVAAEEALGSRARQQEAIATLGLEALAGGPLDRLLHDAISEVAATLDVPLVGILESRGDEGSLLLRAGVGWREGLVGKHIVPAGTASLARYTLEADEPVIAEDLGADWRFAPPASLIQHGAASGISVVVHAGPTPFGTLEALSTERRAFTRDDVHFLQGVATLIGFALDRDRAETALRTAEESFRTLVEAGPGVVYLKNPTEAPGSLSYVSPQVVDLLGYPIGSWTEDPGFWVQVVHPDDRERVFKAIARAVDSEKPFDMEYRLVARDGREVWIHDQTRTIRGTDGTPIVRQGLFIDVTTRRRSEEERGRAVEIQLRLATRLEILHELDRDILSATSVEEMAGRALDRLRLLVPSDRASVTLYRSDEELELVAVRPAGAAAPPAGTMIPVAPALKERQALRSVDVFDLPDPEIPSLDWAAEEGFVSGLAVTLGSEGGPLGALVLLRTDPTPLDEDQIDVATEVASLLAVGVQQQRFREELSERAEELARVAGERRQLVQKIVRAQEEERERVALDIHDGLGQVLTSISLFASDLEEQVPVDARPRAVRVNELIRRAIADSRQLVWGLRPPELDRLGLVPAVRRLAEEVSESGPTTIDFHEEIGDVRLSGEAEVVAYRVVQEAVNNAQKYAKASSISVVLARTDGLLTVLVEDNGDGFDPSEVPEGRGLGLLGMRERAEFVDGSLILESAVGGGTRVRLEVPIGGAGGS